MRSHALLVLLLSLTLLPTAFTRDAAPGPSLPLTYSPKSLLVFSATSTDSPASIGPVTADAVHHPAFSVCDHTYDDTRALLQARSITSTSSTYPDEHACFGLAQDLLNSVAAGKFILDEKLAHIILGHAWGPEGWVPTGADPTAKGYFQAMGFQVLGLDGYPLYVSTKFEENTPQGPMAKEVHIYFYINVQPE